LAVIDGAKAWRKALRQVFGERLVVVRCWLHAGALHAALAAEEADDAACVGYHWGVAEELDLPNLIESLFAVVREKIQRVKNWKARRSKQILR
jgi:hypothetical protein